MARLSGDSSSLGRIGFLLFDMIRETITVCAFLIRMFQLDLVLSFIALIVAPAIFAMVKKYTRKLKRMGKERQDTIGGATAFMQESLAGIQVVKGFNKVDEMVDKYRNVTEEEIIDSSGEEVSVEDETSEEKVEYKKDKSEKEGKDKVEEVVEEEVVEEGVVDVVGNVVRNVFGFVGALILPDGITGLTIGDWDEEEELNYGDEFDVMAIKSVQELKVTDELVKQELCAKDSSFSWCDDE